MARSPSRERAARERLFEAAGQVAYYYRAYDSYGGSRARALRALGRRVPGVTREDLERAFDFFCRVYDVAVNAVEEQARRPRLKGRFSSFEDIDFDACLARLDAIRPGTALPQKRDMLTMVIYWHYLR